MKSIFETQTINEFKTRINQLSEGAEAQWGKMNLYQMLKHCTENERLMLRQKQYSRRFIGRIFGKMALNASIKNDNPLSKNSPTHPDLKFKGDGNIEQEKALWISLLEQYPRMKSTDYNGFVHPFFGKMDSEQISKFAYKHIDHHLRQFGV